MRHRIFSGNGLGNPDKVLLNNKGNLNNEFADAALVEYFSEGFDFQISGDSIAIGIEPAYQYDRLKIISIHKNKENSYIRTGKAWGPYGSQIVSSVKIYKDYKNNSKFIRFVDKWHAVLFGK